MHLCLLDSRCWTMWRRYGMPMRLYWGDGRQRFITLLPGQSLGLAERPRTSFTCPRCGATSYNPQDIAEDYCGRCFWWTGDPVLGEVEPPDA